MMRQDHKSDGPVMGPASAAAAPTGTAMLPVGLPAGDDPADQDQLRAPLEPEEPPDREATAAVPVNLVPKFVPSPAGSPETSISTCDATPTLTPIIFDSAPASPDLVFMGSEANDDSDDPVIKLMRRKLDEGRISRDEYVSMLTVHARAESGADAGRRASAKPPVAADDGASDGGAARGGGAAGNLANDERCTADSKAVERNPADAGVASDETDGSKGASVRARLPSRGFTPSGSPVQRRSVAGSRKQRSWTNIDARDVALSSARLAGSGDPSGTGQGFAAQSLGGWSGREMLLKRLGSSPTPPKPSTGSYLQKSRGGSLNGPVRPARSMPLKVVYDSGGLARPVSVHDIRAVGAAAAASLGADLLHQPRPDHDDRPKSAPAAGGSRRARGARSSPPESRGSPNSLVPLATEVPESPAFEPAAATDPVISPADDGAAYESVHDLETTTDSTEPSKQQKSVIQTNPAIDVLRDASDNNEAGTNGGAGAANDDGNATEASAVEPAFPPAQSLSVFRGHRRSNSGPPSTWSTIPPTIPVRGVPSAAPPGAPPSGRRSKRAHRRNRSYGSVEDLAKAGIEEMQRVTRTGTGSPGKKLGFMRAGAVQATRLVQAASPALLPFARVVEPR